MSEVLSAVSLILAVYLLCGALFAKDPAEKLQLQVRANTFLLLTAILYLQRLV